MQKYISKRLKSDVEFAENYDQGYQAFKFGVVLKEARIEAGLKRAATRLSLLIYRHLG